MWLKVEKEISQEIPVEKIIKSKIWLDTVGESDNNSPHKKLQKINKHEKVRRICKIEN